MANQSAHTPDLSKAVTGAGTRWLYPEVFTPVGFRGGKPRFSVALLIPKTDTRTLDELRCAIEAAFNRDSVKFHPELETMPANAIRSPLRDGDADYPGNPHYAGCYVLHAFNSRPPVVLNAACEPLTDPDEVYSGCYGRAHLRFSFSVYEGRPGFTCWLNALQKCSDGEALAGSSYARDFRAAAARDSALTDEEDLPF